VEEDGVAHAIGAGEDVHGAATQAADVIDRSLDDSIRAAGESAFLGPTVTVMRCFQSGSTVSPKMARGFAFGGSSSARETRAATAPARRLLTVRKNCLRSSLRKLIGPNVCSFSTSRVSFEFIIIQCRLSKTN